jgi:ABC-type sugar transport system substrate-binding protein
VFLIALLPAGLAAPAPQATSPATRYEQIDDLVLQMPAGLLVIPADWQMAGVVARPQGCHASGP